MTDAIAMFAAGIAALALVVAAIAARYSYLQTKAALRQAKAAEQTVQLQAEALKIQAEDMRGAIALAERSAQAAEKSATVAEETARTSALSLESQRASLSIAAIESRKDSSQIPLTVQITFANTGGTSATDVYVIHMADLRQGYPNELEPRTYAPSGPEIIGAGLTYRAHRDVSITKEQHQTLLDFHVSLYTWGLVKYRDFLGPREFTFCYYYSVKEQTWQAMGLFNKQK